MSFGKIIKNARKAKRLKLEDVRLCLNMSLAFLHRLENDVTAKVSYDVIIRIAEFYGLDADRLAAMKGMLPYDVHHKLLNNPELISFVRQLETGFIHHDK